MMKIHTTQDLKSNMCINTTNNNTVPYEFRSNYSNLAMPMHNNMRSGNVSFKKGKNISSNEIKKIIEQIKKVVGDVAKEAKPEVKRGDKFLMSPFFNKLLNVVDYETVVTATVAAAACVARAGTILGMSANDEKNKGNNTYAAVHALASGIVGFVAVFLLTTPFKAGMDHVMKKMFDQLPEKTLKRLHPQLNEKSIVKDGKRISEKIKEVVNGKEIEKIQWKDLAGNDFCKDIKNCDMLPEFKQLAEVSQETFEKILGVKGVDWAAQKGKSFNDVVNKEGKKLNELIDFDRIGIKVAHKEYSEVAKKELETKGQILFRDIDKNYFTELISKTDDANLKRLDISSVFEGDKIKDFRLWKDVEGKQWKMDLDSIFVSSELETANYSPRITGRMREDAKEGIHKFRTYQRNGKNGKLGTEISDDMLRADKENAGLMKSLTWLPDLAFRVPIAMTTVALIPWLLKNLFHIEKNKKPQDVKPQEQQVVPAENKTVSNVEEVKPAFKGASLLKNENPTPEISFKGVDKPQGEPTNEGNVSFKAGKPPKKSAIKKLLDWIGEKMANLYGEKLINSDKMAKVSAKMSDIPGGLTQAMQAFGALLTSGTYVARTINNKDLDPEKRKTLAINQTLCWIVPTIAAYVVDRGINDFVKKKIEYRYSGLQQQKAAVAKLKGNAKASEEILGSLSKKVAGVRTLASLAVFTIIYRYATPVIITPIANKIGEWNSKRQKAKIAKNENQTAKAA